MKYSSTRHRFSDDLILNNESGKGIRLGDPTLYDFGWRDITGPIEVRGVAATDPSWGQVGSGPFYAYNFGIDDIVWMNFHIPHDIVPSSDIYLHAHWLPDGTDVNTVKWQFTYAYAKGFNQENFDMDTGTVITAEEAGPGVAYRHMVTETAAITIPTLTEPDGLLYVQVKRITNGGSENTDNIFMITSDVHYQSTNLTTKNKAPDFYE